jgi:hypothetical protein
VTRERHRPGTRHQTGHVVIPAPPGLFAHYQIERDGKVYRTRAEEVVVAFDDEGAALVLDEDDGDLKRADRCVDFRSVSQYPSRWNTRIVALIPAGGWRVEYTNPDGSESVLPLVGWGATTSGQVVPLAYINEEVEPVDLHKGRVFHPDEPVDDVVADAKVAQP